MQWVRITQLRTLRKNVAVYELFLSRYYNALCNLIL